MRLSDRRAETLKRIETHLAESPQDAELLAGFLQDLRDPLPHDHEIRRRTRTHR